MKPVAASRNFVIIKLNTNPYYLIKVLFHN